MRSYTRYNVIGDKAEAWAAYYVQPGGADADRVKADTTVLYCAQEDPPRYSTHRDPDPTKYHHTWLTGPSQSALCP